MAIGKTSVCFVVFKKKLSSFVMLASANILSYRREAACFLGAIMKPAFWERELIKEIGQTIVIDSRGRVWRIARWINGELVPLKKQRAETKMGRGYFLISAGKFPRYFRALAHRLVYQYFFGNIPDELVVHHKNGNRTDNRPENLAAITQKENIQCALKAGTRNPPRGEAHHAAKLTTSKVKEIHRLYKTGKLTQGGLAKKFGVDRERISRVINGKAWSHVARGV